ncbi:chemotaxis protein MotB [Desulfosarcina widdelii]|uniref:Chemotaxis protein MotB n=1 Tax=Desulfosarcina widdelii TaxID=947919 RepID=A0A5K7ZM95_9BACT|nr:OmpA family protein [Desulfosarcina widdelii]BBO77197.1 chemotaxis protein MotB [Desulfosarcina widdelii]
MRAGQGMTVETDSFLWSLADLMTLMLIFFIMLYANAVQRPTQAVVQSAATGTAESEAKPATDDRMDGVFSENSAEMAVQKVDGINVQPIEASEQKAPRVEKHSPDEDLNHRLIDDLADRFTEDFYVRWEDRQPVFVLGERITFNVGQAGLLDEARGTLRRVARLISRMSVCQVVITGHTDDLPIHTKAFPSNWELSAGRAASVARALIESGVSPRQLVIQGQSQFKPLVNNTNDTDRRTNRRVEISLISG